MDLSVQSICEYEGTTSIVIQKELYKYKHRTNRKKLEIEAS